MILQSLVHYYEALERADRITRPGWCNAKVSFGLELSGNGELLAIIPLKQPVQRGKKTVMLSIDMKVPQFLSRSSEVSANFLCDNSSYLLGIDSKGKPERSRKCFKTFFSALVSRSGCRKPGSDPISGGNYGGRQPGVFL